MPSPREQHILWQETWWVYKGSYTPPVGESISAEEVFWHVPWQETDTLARRMSYTGGI